MDWVLAILRQVWQFIWDNREPLVRWFKARVSPALAKIWQYLCNHWKLLVPVGLSLVILVGVISAVKSCDTCDGIRGDVFRDCPECPEMVVIPDGTFTMGSPSAEIGHTTREEPQHQVEMPYSLAVGKYEITRGEYAHFVNATGYVGDGRGCSHWDEQQQRFVEDPGTTFLNPGIPQDDHHPVTCVNWNDANAYMDWLRRTTHAFDRIVG